MQRPRTRYARCGKISIAYQVIGDGPIDLVYAPGWINNIEYAWESPDFARLLTKLGQFSRVIFFDKRGSGLSDRLVGAPTLEDRAEDIATVMDAAGSREAAILGTSEGGNMACMFSALYPERATSLILYGCFARMAWAPDYPWGTKPEDFEASLSGIIEAWGEPYDFGDWAPSAANDQAAREWYSAFMRFSLSPTEMLRLSRLNFEIDIRALLPSIRQRTLVLHRQGDLCFDVEEGRFLAEHIPTAELHLLPGDDHLAFYGDHDRLVGEVEEFLTGTRGATSAERALLTVLMTDIVGSTDALSDMGDERWRAVLEQLDAAVRRRVAALGGQLVKQTGDGHLLAFTGPTRAIECARAIGRDAEALGLQLRAGLHTGECERRTGDLSGIAVHLAARIMAEATPGAVWTSGTVKDLVVGSGLAFAPQGERALKGIPGTWPLFAVSG
ncbi:MAG TPA: adenylate/guanylate cyclase domain-containing protein [Thermohalobaculum sp.]|nr:adenylate/guanylate cyclase domain-containing protein [Thermohalobaculum sp.]